MAFTLPPAVIQTLIATLAKSSPELLTAAKMVADFDRKIDLCLANQAIIMEALNVRRSDTAAGLPAGNVNGNAPAVANGLAGTDAVAAAAKSGA